MCKRNISWLPSTATTTQARTLTPREPVTFHLAGWSPTEPHWSGLFLPPSLSSSLPFFFKDFIFRQRGEEGEREGEKHQCVREVSTGCLSNVPGPQPRHVLTGNLPCDLLVPKMVPSPWNCTSQGRAYISFVSSVHSRLLAQCILIHVGGLKWEVCVA